MSESILDRQARAKDDPNLVAATSRDLLRHYVQFDPARYGMGVDAEGYFFVENLEEETTSYFRAWRVSPCCGASAKGCDGDGVGYTACRACYEEIDPAIGLPPTFDGFAYPLEA